MKRTAAILLVCLISISLFSACSGNPDTPVFASGEGTGKIPEFAIATKIQKEDYQNLDYTGSELEIPYMLQDQSEANARWGLEILLNGILQEFRIKGADGDEATPKTMHVFSMKKQETKYLTLVFTPNTGKAGEKLNLNICTILNPNFLPEDINHTEFRPYHNLNGGLGVCLTMGKDAPAQTQTSSAGTRQAKITQEQKAPYVNNNARDKNGNQITTSELDQRLILQLYQTKSDEQIIKASPGQPLVMTLNCFGLPGRYRICVFVNHTAVPVFDGKNYLDITVTKDFTVQRQITLSMSGCAEKNSVYAVASPIRTEPAPEQWYLEKTPSKFLIVP